MHPIDNIKIDYNTKPLFNAAFCGLPFSRYLKPTSKTKLDLAYMALADKKAQERHAEGRPNRGEDYRLVNTLQCPTENRAINKRAPIARFYAREWSGQHRVRVESFNRLQKAPMPVLGDRATEALTESAARKITDAGAYVGACKGGFKTFLTLTLDSAARVRIEKLRPVPVIDGKKGDLCSNVHASGDFYRLCFEDGFYSKLDWKTESTIGKEVSRFMDGIQKKYQRGWTWEPSKGEKTVEMGDLIGGGDQFKREFMPPEYVGYKASNIGAVPIAKRLNYIWVAENPDRQKIITNQNGEQRKVWTGTNPHVHVLLDWAVKRHHFLGWAEQLESLWGLGFANLQRVKNPLAASAYLLKALGYMTKGAHHVDVNTGEVMNSQGRINGNRYGISKDARAPAWECIAEFEAHHMARIIETTSLDINRAKDAIKMRLEKLADDETQAIRNKAIWKRNNKNPALQHKKLAEVEIEFHRILEHRKRLVAERRAKPQASKYQLTFITKQQRDRFITDAVLAKGWAAKLASTATVNHFEYKKVSSWATEFFNEIGNVLQAAKNDFECYWRSIFTDCLPISREFAQ
jgi:hypothetical protein